MNDQERADIIGMLKDLPEKDKQFMLGYAAGRCASDAGKDEEQKNDKDQASA